MSRQPPRPTGCIAAKPRSQREAAEAYIKSQAQEGWRLLRTRYDDGGLSGGTLERPALQSLLSDIRARKVDVVVVYKVDRLTRSLADFAKLVEVYEAHGVSFVAVTQQFNTTTSMGRLTLNVLLSFAQFERGAARNVGGYHRHLRLPRVVGGRRIEFSGTTGRVDTTEFDPTRCFIAMVISP
jgi:Resolvase, N terminal domain